MVDKVQSQSPGFFQSLYDGVFKGDFSSNDSKTKTVAQIGVGLVPFVGQAADVRDTAAALHDVKKGRSGGWSNLGFALVGWVPLAGDFAKSVHKVGIRGTLSAVRGAFDSVADSWRSISRYGEEKMGSFKGLFYKPATELRGSDLPPGAYGVTNRWGDIEISDELDDITAASTLDHEQVHSFLSPKLKYGQELRAKISLLGYAESHLLRRVEEGLAEGWARWKAEGISAVAKGWRFPLENPYGIDPQRVKIERNVLVGMASTAVAAGAEIGEKIGNDE
jgi:hypothetical protein